MCGKCTYSIYNPKIRKCEEPKRKIKHCIEYGSLSPLKCSICEFGFGITKHGGCVRCHKENCAVCNESQDICDACFGGLIPTDTHNDCDPEKSLKCEDKACRVCGRNGGLCIKCMSGFSLSSDLKCVFGKENCYMMNEDRTNCELCSYGYYITGKGNCIRNDTVKGFDFQIIFLCIIVVFILFIAYLFCNCCKFGKRRRNNGLYEEDHYEQV